MTVFAFILELPVANNSNCSNYFVDPALLFLINLNILSIPLRKKKKNTLKKVDPSLVWLNKIVSRCLVTSVELKNPSAP